MLKSSFVVFG
jgi:hypothetical protein